MLFSAYALWVVLGFCLATVGICIFQCVVSAAHFFIFLGANIMKAKDEKLCCLCCYYYSVEFDNFLMPNKILGGTCKKFKKESEPYTEKCPSFHINDLFIPGVKNNPHSVEAYIRRNFINDFDIEGSLEHIKHLK